MFIPRNFKMAKLADQQKFIHEYGFGVVVSAADSLVGIHLPFVLDTENSEKGVLYTHCAKANPHWQHLEGQKVIVIFTGPHGYISPSWYENQPAVPTWNYTAVHVYGVATLLETTQTLHVVDRVVTQYEPQLLEKRDIITDQLKDRMLAAIVGFKIVITDIQGQMKLGQNRSKTDQAGVYRALSQSNRYSDLELAATMQKLHTDK